MSRTAFVVIPYSLASFEESPSRGACGLSQRRAARKIVAAASSEIFETDSRWLRPHRWHGCSAGGDQSPSNAVEVVRENGGESVRSAGGDKSHPNAVEAVRENNSGVAARSVRVDQSHPDAVEAGRENNGGEAARESSQVGLPGKGQEGVTGAFQDEDDGQSHESDGST